MGRRTEGRHERARIMAAWRASLGLTQREMSRVVGQEVRLLSQWEEGLHDMSALSVHAISRLEAVPGSSEAFEALLGTETSLVWRLTAARGITQKELVRRLGVSKSIVSGWHEELPPARRAQLTAMMKDEPIPFLGLNAALVRSLKLDGSLMEEVILSRNVPQNL